MMRFSAVLSVLLMTACEATVRGAPQSATSYAWAIGEPGVCDAPGFCGIGTLSRSVTCVSDRGETVSDNFCTESRPVTDEACVATSGCLWQADPVGDCNAPTSCSAGSETRVISCRDYLGEEVDPSWCVGPAPDAVGSCFRTTGCSWETGSFGGCEVGGCGEGLRTRNVACVGLMGETVADSWCPAPVPARAEACADFSACVFDVGAWSACNNGCGYGARSRSVTCETPSGAPVAFGWCGGDAPATSEACLETANCCPPQAMASAPFAGGAGTTDAPYVICTATQLNQMRTSLASSYLLGRDIDLAGVSLPPTGSVNDSFAGVFDGAFHTLSHWSYSEPTTSYVGLFGRATGSIKQLHLVDVDVEGDDHVGALCGASVAHIRDVTVSGTVRGNNVVGGLAGLMHTSTVSAVQTATAVHGVDLVGGIAGDLENTQLANATSAGSVTGTRFVGGVVGQVDRASSVTNATWSGSVVGTENVGGVAGSNVGYAIVRASSSGTVTGSSYVGGAVGSSSSGVFDVWSTSAVSGSTYVGGLVGFNDGLVARAFSTGPVTGTTQTGGLVGGGPGTVRRAFWDMTSSTQATSVGGSGLTSTAMRASDTYAEWDQYLVWQTEDGALPLFRDQPQACVVGAAAFSGGAGTPASPYVIDHPAQLYDINCNLRASYVLAGDLDFHGIPATPPVGSLDTLTPFSGTFDGAGFAIAHWSGYSDRGGLFRRADGATFKNLRLDDVEFGGGYAVGALVGTAYASTLSRVAVQGTVFGAHSTGGITGELSGTLTRLSANVDVLGGGYTGGLFGFCNAGQVSDSYALGSIIKHPLSDFSASGFAGGGTCTVVRSYAAVAMTGSPVAGFSYGANVTTIDSFWDSEVSGTGPGGGGAPKTTSEMRTQSTFVGWDFDTIWRIEPGAYPTLR